MNQDDDRLAVNTGAYHFFGGLPYGREAFLQRQRPPGFALSFRQMAQRVFRDDHRPVDDQAEIDCAKTHQLYDAPLQHSGCGHQHRERDDQRRDKSGTEVAKQQKQNGDNEQGTFAEISLPC